MYIVLPFVTVMLVTVIIYFIINKFGVNIRFLPFLLCSIAGLSAGLALPRLLIPQISFTATALLVLLAMFCLSLVMTWLFGMEEYEPQKDAVGGVTGHYDQQMPVLAMAQADLGLYEENARHDNYGGQTINAIDNKSGMVDNKGSIIDDCRDVNTAEASAMETADNALISALLTENAEVFGQDYEELDDLPVDNAQPDLKAPDEQEAQYSENDLFDAEVSVKGDEQTINTEKTTDITDYDKLISEEAEQAINAEQTTEQTKPFSAAASQVPKTDSLDDLLDFSFAQKEQKNWSGAVHAFQMAYEMYPESDFSMLITIEIANIYKQIGEYDKAIATLQRDLDKIKVETMRHDFIFNIAYLRIVKNILKTNKLALLPYDEIPDKVKEDIEKEFSEWKVSA